MSRLLSLAGATLRLLGHRRLADVLLVAWATWFLQLVIFSQASPLATVQAMGTMWMFLGLYLALAVNLVACFVVELPRALARTRPHAGIDASFPPGGFEALTPQWSSLDLAEAALRRRLYRVKREEGRLVADRGRYASVFGPLFHLVLPLLLPAIVFSVSTREVLGVPVGEGETIPAMTEGPGESLTVTDIHPTYLDDEIFFTHLSAKVAVGDAAPRTVTINESVPAGGGEVRLKSMGYLPGLEIWQGEQLVERSLFKANLFPPGTEAEVSLAGSPHRLFVTLYPDGSKRPGLLPENRTLELENPLLAVRAVRGALPVGSGVLGLGEALELEGQRIVFARADLWVALEWVRDPWGKVAMLLGLIALLLLSLKIFWPRTTWVIVQDGEGLKAARRIEAFAALIDDE
ncbi:MAG: cytochrome c biogenesis protein ResB [Deltaproteobacteria bacterium]|nr:cytochrome c biogenesis protein ResB [Deltaproteobacteria bacterium]